MTLLLALTLVLSAVAPAAPLRAQQDAEAAQRILQDALSRVYRLRDYTAFDWIAANYNRGTLTLQGFARTPDLKRAAENEARKARGAEVIVNNIEVLPSLRGDDEIRARAYGAIYGSSALERYAPGGQLNPSALRELQDAARFGLDGVDVGRGPHAIHIVVSGARVLLLGEVRASGDAQIAESTMRTLPGVLGVTNQLRVAGRK
jgi:osmotically-inducible protein OsmY